MKDKTLSVSAIQKGTVIDHIPADSLFDVLSILKLDELDSQITFGTNLKSQKYGTKALIKLEGTFFKADEINRIALVAPDAKLNIIEDYHVVEKKDVGLPDEVEGIAKCMNPKCVTNHESIVTRFTVIDKKHVDLKCHYCEKVTDKPNLEII
ncbi:aspartate carbamoyltransferase regulatory subunit [Salinivirga cyanobacteriivorans]